MKILDSIAIRLPGRTDEEKKMKSLISRCNRKLSTMPVGKNGEKYDELKSEFRTRLNKYRGRFSNYFTNKFESLEFTEKYSLGYGLHSNSIF